jgi:hypothetical protein
MNPANALIFAVAVVALPNMVTLAFLATLWRRRLRRATASRIAAGLRFAFHTGRLAPLRLPLQ